MATTQTPLATFNIVIYHDGDYWIGHCVELDLVTSGVDPHSVREDAVNVCMAQVMYALGNNLLGNLLRPPNQNIAKMMLEGQLKGELDIKLNTRTFDHQRIDFRVLSQAA